MEEMLEGKKMEIKALKKDVNMDVDVNMVDFLDQIMASDTPLVPMPGTKRAPIPNPNLDSSKE